MGKNSAISWTDHTFNPWWGCTEVSPACDDCYARKWAERCGFKNLWGPGHELRQFGEKHWNEPLKWNAAAIQEFSRPARVFCGSMCDIFEVHPIAETIRPRLKQLITKTLNLDWLLLTKRGLDIAKHEEIVRLPNVRMGVTVENQIYDWRIVFPFVEWLSVEPMLEPLDISRFTFVRWVVIGGESKQRADKEPREMNLDHTLDLIQQCKKAGIAVHFKQTGDVLARKLGLKDRSGKDPTEWPTELRIQEFPVWADYAETLCV